MSASTSGMPSQLPSPALSQSARPAAIAAFPWKASTCELRERRSRRSYPPCSTRCRQSAAVVAYCASLLAHLRGVGS